MSEKEEAAFRTVFGFYARWRDTVIETDEQWTELADDFGRTCEALDTDNNPLGWYLLTAVMETINDLYKGGMKPMPAGYFGRDDT